MLNIKMQIRGLKAGQAKRSSPGWAKASGEPFSGRTVQGQDTTFEKVLSMFTTWLTLEEDTVHMRKAIYVIIF